MFARRPPHPRARPGATPKENFLGRLLDPIDLLSEAVFSWGRHTGTNAWKTGLLLAAIALVMVLIAIPLGG